MNRGTKVIFKHPTEDTLQVGIVNRFRYFPKLDQTLYTVISEKGEFITRIPILEKGQKGRRPDKYIHQEYTDRIIPKIATNLRLDNQANYHDRSYRPAELRT